jgi:multicomponent Na+:H+ antiporter subunit E
MIAKISLFLLWFFVWLILSWPPAPKDIIEALLVSLFVSYMTVDLLLQPSRGEASRKGGIVNNAARVPWAIYYVVVFLWECLKANIDVAYRVIHPQLPIRPGTVKVKVGLKSDIGLTFLANSITLTPGTTSVDVDKDNGYLYVHWLCVKEDGRGLKVVGRFENILKRIFE